MRSSGIPTSSQRNHQPSMGPVSGFTQITTTYTIDALISALIAILIGLALTTPVATQAGALALNKNLTSGGQSLVALVPLLYVVLIFIAILGFMRALREGHDSFF